MKKLLKTMICVSIAISVVFSANKRILKSEMKMDKMNQVEPDYRVEADLTRACPSVLPNHPNASFTHVGTSSNGYGMVSSVTRPFDINSDGSMSVVYRQYAGENTTHGQLGASQSVVVNGQNVWSEQWNINYNGNPPWGGSSAQARYPSTVASEAYPYAFWNEYTGQGCPGYGGRPYYSYDGFGWGGQSWMYPIEMDPLYNCTKDLWAGSVGNGYDASTDEQHMSVVYSDWTRTGSYLFTSEAVVDGYIVFGTEILIINPQHLGTGGYSSAAILSMNDNGQGLLGVDGIFAGVDMDAGTCGLPASNLTCNKVPMFKLTDNFGATWYGNHAAFDLYYLPDTVLYDIFDTWPNTDTDECTGEISDIEGFWSWYEFDMRVDNDGNPHFIISLIPESENYFHFIDGVSGYYHFTIDRDNVANPGPVNSPTGWNWSYVPLPANDSFVWNRPNGSSYLYGAMAQLSMSRENPDVIYATGNLAETGLMSSVYDADGDGIEDDPCGYQDWPWQLYPEWSEDIWVAKSTDNGSTWTSLDNVTSTPRDPDNAGINNCTPDDQYPHTAHWATDDRVYFQYQHPNWEWNELGDPGGADHMNYVFAGYFNVEDGGSGCTNALGDINDDGTMNVLDIVAVVNEILGGGLADCALEAADYNTDGTINVLDIVAMVSLILGNRGVDATSATIQINDGALLLKSDGYIGGVQMTLQHNKDFSIELTDRAMISEYNTVGNETILVIVVPESEELFTFAGDFEIVDMIVANSEVEVNVDMQYVPTMVTEFSLSTAYPNPFNPITSMTLAIPEAGQVSVQVYNLMGQVVATLANEYMDANTYTTLTWNASNVSSGIYFVKMIAGDYINTQRLMLVK